MSEAWGRSGGVDGGALASRTRSVWTFSVIGRTMMRACGLWCWWKKWDDGGLSTATRGGAAQGVDARQFIVRCARHDARGIFTLAAEPKGKTTRPSKESFIPITVPTSHRGVQTFHGMSPASCRHRLAQFLNTLRHSSIAFTSSLSLPRPDHPFPLPRPSYHPPHHIRTNEPQCLPRHPQVSQPSESDGVSNYTSPNIPPDNISSPLPTLKELDDVLHASSDEDEDPEVVREYRMLMTHDYAQRESRPEEGIKLEVDERGGAHRDGERFVYRAGHRGGTTRPPPWKPTTEVIVIDDGDERAPRAGTKRKHGAMSGQGKELIDPDDVALRARVAAFKRQRDILWRNFNDKEQLRVRLGEELDVALERDAAARAAKQAARELRKREWAGLVAARDRWAEEAARAAEETASASERCTALSSRCDRLCDERDALLVKRRECDARREELQRVIEDAQTAIGEIEERVTVIARDEAEFDGRVEAEEERFGRVQAMKVAALEREREALARREDAELAIELWEAERSEVDQGMGMDQGSLKGEEGTVRSEEADDSFQGEVDDTDPVSEAEPLKGEVEDMKLYEVALEGQEQQPSAETAEQSLADVPEALSCNTHLPPPTLTPPTTAVPLPAAPAAPPPPTRPSPTISHPSTTPLLPIYKSFTLPEFHIAAFETYIDHLDPRPRDTSLVSTFRASLPHDSAALSIWTRSHQWCRDTVPHLAHTLTWREVANRWQREIKSVDRRGELVSKFRRLLGEGINGGGIDSISGFVEKVADVDAAMRGAEFEWSRERVINGLVAAVAGRFAGGRSERVEELRRRLGEMGLEDMERVAEMLVEWARSVSG
ncbi:hypothetical protein BDK51DRAFT_50813 [Blyttiomyces helicus]|uniref:Uncharacterized protein n=1 Tax=Blyttiomyces helicus TaxID=388810 RepID=A0A4P9W5B1_9FUNG|nr:hypothetical protein BDK51DRAFT_50813 [Blyttiomyces helicus]|eukprot:RKO85930.1 hypothetical protein BDK51DRAFT_50813 [Blyttiomyces helicus]